MLLAFRVLVSVRSIGGLERLSALSPCALLPRIHGHRFSILWVDLVLDRRRARKLGLFAVSSGDSIDDIAIKSATLGERRFGIRRVFA
jgi:hypothetical protein